MEIKDKVAVVTGGASGLGRATVKRLVAAGGKCAIFDMNEEKGNALAAELGENVIFCKVNVVDEESVAAAIAATMDAFGAIHIDCNPATRAKAHTLPIRPFGTLMVAGLLECAAKIPVTRGTGRITHD